MDHCCLQFEFQHDIGCQSSAPSSKTGPSTEQKDEEEMAVLDAVRNGHAKQFTERDLEVPRANSLPKQIEISSP
jgi:hypothetical protein